MFDTDCLPDGPHNKCCAKRGKSDSQSCAPRQRDEGVGRAVGPRRMLAKGRPACTRGPFPCVYPASPQMRPTARAYWDIVQNGRLRNCLRGGGQERLRRPQVLCLTRADAPVALGEDTANSGVATATRHARCRPLKRRSERRVNLCHSKMCRPLFGRKTIFHLRFARDGQRGFAQNGHSGVNNCLALTYSRNLAREAPRVNPQPRREALC